MPVDRTTPLVVPVVGGTIGVLLLVLGLVTLARTGIPADSFVDPTTSIGPFTRTPLMGIIEIVLGVLVIGASATGDRGSLLAVGLISLVFSLVWLIEPGAFQDALGVGRETALLYLVVAIVCIVAGLLGRGDGRVVRRERTVIDP